MLRVPGRQLPIPRTYPTHIFRKHYVPVPRISRQGEAARRLPSRYAVESVQRRTIPMGQQVLEQPPEQLAKQGGYIAHSPTFSEHPESTAVSIPTSPDAVLKPGSNGAALLSNSALVIGRQLEMLNVFMGFEQANKYAIMNPDGQHVGFIAEEESFASSVSRQFLRTHRRFNATVMDASGNIVFKIHRPFQWINSRIYISTANDEIIGEVQQTWHAWRRRYDLFVNRRQFAQIDEGLFAWDFYLRDEQGGLLGNVNRNFVGFARELFTDTGQYVLRMDAVEGAARGLTLDERAVTLACAISIDFDYFSRHSHAGSPGFMPLPFWGYGEPVERSETPAEAGSGTVGGVAGAGMQAGASAGTGAAAGAGADASNSHYPPFEKPREHPFGEQQTYNDEEDIWAEDPGVYSPPDDNAGWNWNPFGGQSGGDGDDDWF